jgi:uncharacterized protein YndB with AHSA1/START domain
MPLQKDFKRVVRARMQKTGESYTAARAQLIRRRSPRPAAVPAAPPPDYAKLAGMSDSAISNRTGRDWAGWVQVLDGLGAHAWPHRRIAETVHAEYGVRAWWTQAVTVGYERIKGLREIGQRRSGAYEASRSKTITAPVEKVYRAFADTRSRNKWLPDVKLTRRKATPNKSVRITWGDGTDVTVWLTVKGEGKSGKEKVSVAVTHAKLAGKDDAAARKAYWGDRLAALAGMVE